MAARRARKTKDAASAESARPEPSQGSSSRGPSGNRPHGVVAGPADGSAHGARFDRVIHQPVRLSIVSLLAVHESLTFTELKRELETSDGNLSVHARKLEEAGYVDCEKTFRGRTPETRYRLTADGRRALERYLTHMEALILAVKSERD